MVRGRTSLSARTRVAAGGEYSPQDLPMLFVAKLNKLVIDDLNAKLCASDYLALRKAIGSPQIIWVPAGHYRAILFLPDIRERTIEFVQGREVKSLR